MVAFRTAAITWGPQPVRTRLASSPLVTSRTEDLSTLLLRIPDPEIRSLFTPAFILCCEEFDRFTTEMVLRLVRDLRIDEPGGANDLLHYERFPGSMDIEFLGRLVRARQL